MPVIANNLSLTAGSASVNVFDNTNYTKQVWAVIDNGQAAYTATTFDLTFWLAAGESLQAFTDNVSRIADRSASAKRNQICDKCATKGRNRRA